MSNYLQSFFHIEMIVNIRLKKLKEIIMADYLSDIWETN